MDEITMYATLRPDPPAGQDTLREAVRERVRAGLGGPAPRQPRNWRWPAGLGIAAAATTAIALVATTGGAPRPAEVVTAAWTVRENPGGTITIELRQFADLPGLRRVLAADGVTAVVVSIPMKTGKAGKTTYEYPACSFSDADDAPMAVQQAVVRHEASFPGGFVIRSSAMPQGSALLITSSVMRMPTGATAIAASMPRVLRHDQKPACLPVAPPPPAGPAS